MWANGFTAVSLSNLHCIGTGNLEVGLTMLVCWIPAVLLTPTPSVQGPCHFLLPSPFVINYDKMGLQIRFCFTWNCTSTGLKNDNHMTRSEKIHGAQRDVKGRCGLFILGKVAFPFVKRTRFLLYVWCFFLVFWWSALAVAFKSNM